MVNAGSSTSTRVLSGAFVVLLHCVAGAIQSAAVNTKKLPRIILVLLGFGCGVIATSHAATAETKSGIGLRLVAEGLVSPLNLASLPDGSGRLLIADQIGTIHMLAKEGKLQDELFLDLRDRRSPINTNAFDERGLLGIAFHPRFRANSKFYVAYSAPLRKGGPEGWNCTTHISEFKVAKDGKADAASERVLLQIDKPYFNHNGGRLAFGRDGYLYISVGDGGNANDMGLGHSPQGNGQDLTTLLGKILRIDVDKGDPYAIPHDNPFKQGSGRPEIFAYGLRNPWGMSFDRSGKHQLFASDVGQTMFEEVNIVVKGGNYGWFIREGFHCFDPKKPNRPPEDCPRVGADGKPLLDPILEYKNVNGFPKDPEARGCSVTGGYVYRGKALPQLKGRYVFADWSRNFVVPQGVLLVATPPASRSQKVWTLEQLKPVTHPKEHLGMFVVAIGEDAEGELYVLTNSTNALLAKNGKVFKLVPM
jgi:glucose/arabinose dehydrogenase